MYCTVKGDRRIAQQKYSCSIKHVLKCHTQIKVVYMYTSDDANQNIKKLIGSEFCSLSILSTFKINTD